MCCSSLGAGVSRNVLDQIADGIHGFAVLFANLEIELTLTADVYLAHIESVEADLVERGTKCDSCRVIAVIMEGEEPDDTLGYIHRVSIVVTLLTWHQHVVLVVSTEWGHGNDARHSHTGSLSLGEETSSEHFFFFSLILNY